MLELVDYTKSNDPVLLLNIEKFIKNYEYLK